MNLFFHVLSLGYPTLTLSLFYVSVIIVIHSDFVRVVSLDAFHPFVFIIVCPDKIHAEPVADHVTDIEVVIRQQDVSITVLDAGAGSRTGGKNVEVLSL